MQSKHELISLENFNILARYSYSIAIASSFSVNRNCRKRTSHENEQMCTCVLAGMLFSGLGQDLFSRPLSFSLNVNFILVVRISSPCYNLLHENT